MGRRWRAASVVLAAALATGVPSPVPAQADPATGTAPASSRPTVDPTAPTPTAPRTGLPPRGSAPDGSTVGGERLRTRGVVVAADAPPLPDGIAASGWLVADAGTGAVLGARDPHGRYYPASTLKTLTLLTLVPRLDPALVVEGTVEDEQIEGSRVGLVAGGRYPVPLLFSALVLQSGNDAASALARAAGGQAATVAAMNRTAAELGAFDTVAGTPSGLDVAGQSTSPYDLALFFRALVEDPVTAEVLRTPTADMPAVEGRGPGFQIQNQNPLLTSYPGNLGGKTGFTDAARHAFVTAAERDGRRLVVSVLDTENVPLRAADQAARLLDWGFAVAPTAAGVGRLVRPADLVAAPTTRSSAAPVLAPPGTAAAPADASPVGEPAGRPWTAVAVTVVALAVLGAVSATLRGRRRARPTPPAPAPGRRPAPPGRWRSRRR
ncbi:D-alanyl-D-alanine carboxypeptidase family protein [Blastococcus sp. VKM Ac-2987]|uniref:D-alanyl-D-alanine carboxypeptidase family protein n=1 Tax=Blastococcus sp. VKM Ac-2987 TaxID=3004141 RepID=UPI0022ABAD6E|nr:serine hydrolase [Blastococcus sp. VKM Ac-2987]MCZ2859497.1 serine hydrolase [Blastococcus sp. VKM Ac-2987]